MRTSAAEALGFLGGTAEAKQLLELTTQWSLRSAETRGEVLRVAHGVYALPGILPEKVAAARAHGVISHQSAAAYWLMESISAPAKIHVTVPRNSRPATRKGLVLHYADLDDERVTSPLRTVLDCAVSLPFHEALAIADSACRRGLLEENQVLAAAQRSRGRGRQLKLRVANHVDARAANPFESGLRAILIEAGISGFQPQLFVPETGARVDLGDSARRMALEADSFTHHGTRKALETDCRRYDELIRHDWLVLRFAWEHVMFDRSWVAETVVATCSLRDGTGPARKGRR